MHDSPVLLLSLLPILLTTFPLDFLRDTRFFLNGVCCPLCFRLSSACSSRGCLLLSSGLNFDEKDFPYHFFTYLLSSQPHCKPMRAGSTTFFNHHVPSTSTVPNTREAFTKHIWNKYRHFCHGSHFIL